MITNDLLKTKYETQKRLDQEAQHSLRKYVELGHGTVQKIADDYGLKLKYRSPTIARSKVEETKDCLTNVLVSE